MPQITVQCSNPESIQLRVTAEMPIGQWKEIVSRLRETKYYGPLCDLMDAIGKGITAIELREDVRYETQKKRLPGSEAK